MKTQQECPEATFRPRKPEDARIILVVDDDICILKAVSRFLSARGFDILTATDASSGYQIACETTPMLILSDAEMTGMNGFQLCRVLKADPRTSQIPVILMSGAWTRENDQLTGFERGADDYLIKPLSLRLLHARVEALLARTRATPNPGEVLEAYGLTVRPDARTSQLHGNRLHLTPKEFDLLALLMRKRGRVLSTAYLLETIWGYDPADYNNPHTVEVHVSSLRKKLGKDLGKFIVNAVGHGYKLDE